MHTLLIADNQAITRLGIASLVKQLDIPYQLIDCSTKEKLGIALRDFPEALVVLDYTLFNYVGIDDLLVMTERYKDAHWLLFSDELSPDFLQKALICAPNMSVVMKDASQEELQMAIQHVLRKQRFVCNYVSNLLLTFKTTSEPAQYSPLTETEKTILKEIALGNTTKDIAAKKFISFHTVNTHRKNIFRKLGVNNVHEATKYAMRAGIIDVAEYCI
ncbi:MAG: response regulator transcription factor [Paludibacteraceae bacterium]|nr:response regulator transcription factor [Paludibacteraceae bacterium]MBP6284529.1 response regulator transcription factor [Paludibacteraceae bacterium]